MKISKIKIGDVIVSTGNNQYWYLVEDMNDLDMQLAAIRIEFPNHITPNVSSVDLHRAEEIIRKAPAAAWVSVYGNTKRVLEAIERGKVADLGHERIEA